jgi:bifunctional ADP-heptose synthase (sugar kinase/adenylyltransferase)
LEKIIHELGDIKIFLIGDTIIDKYVFVLPKGRAIKDPILSVDYCYDEIYPGGILAIANHLSEYVKEISLITVIGDRINKKRFITNCLRKNVNPIFFIKKDSPTTTKIRYVNKQRNEKLFKIEYINDYPLDDETEREIINYLKEKLGNYDLTIVGDFGHGFISDNMIKILKKHSKFLAVNVQTNSANLGFNLVTKYKIKPEFMTMDLREIQYAVEDRFSDLPILIDKLKNKMMLDKFLITLGKSGSCLANGSEFFSAPVVSLKSVDTVGAGDAVFSLTSLLIYRGVEGEIIPFIGNCAGGIAANIIGNKEPVTKNKLLNLINNLYIAGSENIKLK